MGYEGLQEVELILVRPDQTSLLTGAIQLGDRARRTLGLLPRAAYAAAAAAGTLLVATEGEAVVAYALYGLPRQQVRLAHLCVTEAARGRGLARLLVDEISRHHADRTGIVAKCRRDYGLDDTWRALGFREVNEVQGRGKDRARITVWWRDHGLPDLFSSNAEPPILSAAIDLNILRDLHSDSVRAAAAESQVLVADFLTDSLQLVVTPGLTREIDGITEDAPRTRLRAALSHYAYRSGTSNQSRDAFARLIQAVRQQDARYPRTPQDEADAVHVAEAAAAGVPVLVTRDSPMRDRLGRAAQEVLAVRILSPSDVAVHIDELTHAAAYQPGRLQNTDLHINRMRSGSEAEALALLNRDEGERQQDFRRRLRESALSGDFRFFISDPQAGPLACYAYSTNAAELKISLFRVKEHSLAQTLARQVLFLLRQEARDSRCQVLRLEDPHPSLAVRKSLYEDGFRNQQDSWCALVVDVCDASSVVEAATLDAARIAGLSESAHLRPMLPAVPCAEAERNLWPAKIMDSQLPTFLVPINPPWSADLFGVPQTLLTRPVQLGIGREHVYYRSPRPWIFEAPARLLWYVTSGKALLPGTRSVVACSLLEQIISGTPDVLYERLHHLGVWRRDHLQAVAKNGIVQALRFTNTEMLRKTVPLKVLKDLADQNCQTLVLRSANKIASDLFADVYKEGRRP